VPETAAGQTQDLVSRLFSSPWAFAKMRWERFGGKVPALSFRAKNAWELFGGKVTGRVFAPKQSAVSQKMTTSEEK
jgi:hypothetical protein